MNRVQNKIALVTGAARGIGAATARLLAEEGAHVIVTDVLEAEGLQLVSELQARSLKAAYYPLDVSSEGAWKALSLWILKHYGDMDIVVNNAGIIGLGGHWGPQDPEHVSLADWRAIHAVNLDGVFLGCRYAITWMKACGGSIVNVSSRSGMVGIPGAAAYASSKAAVRNHSKTVALYCAQQGYKIRCNSVHPGAILTPLWEPLLGGDRQAAIAAVASGIPLGHMGEPRDVAYAILYLACDESKYVTGTELTLDGGILAGSTAAPK